MPSKKKGRLKSGPPKIQSNSFLSLLFLLILLFPAIPPWISQAKEVRRKEERKKGGGRNAFIEKEGGQGGRGRPRGASREMDGLPVIPPPPPPPPTPFLLEHPSFLPGSRVKKRLQQVHCPSLFLSDARSMHPYLLGTIHGTCKRLHCVYVYQVCVAHKREKTAEGKKSLTVNSRIC